MTTWYNLAPQPNWQEWLGVTVSASPNPFLFSADSLTDTITVENGNNYFTGKAVMVSSVGGVVPAPLNESSVYYIIYLSSNSYKLASSYANATAGTAIDLTDNGSGTLSIISTGVVYLQPNANGYIRTLSSLNHELNKPTYTDWTGATENTNPVVLDDRGQAVIYWLVNSLEPDDNYYIEIYNANNVLLYSRDNFNAPPGLESSGGETTTNPINLLINNEFDFWGMYDYGVDEISDVVANVSVTDGLDVETAYYWLFNKTNDNATDIITRKAFPIGQTDVPNTPQYYCRLACTNAGSGGETQKNFYQKFSGVNNFAGETINFSFYAKSVTNGVVISPYIDQYFGISGSSSVQTYGDDIVLTTSWTKYSVTIEVPDINGKNVQNLSFVALVIGLPINSTYQIDIANTQLTISDTVLTYRQMTKEERFALISSYKQATTGEILTQAFGTIPDTWISLANGTVGNGASGATYASPQAKSLFKALWTYNDAICPVYDSSGAKVTRGASSEADFDANRRIQLFFNGGRTITNTGAPDIQFVYTPYIDEIDPSITRIYVNGDSEYANRTLYKGVAVKFTTTGTLPAPLVADTVYYLNPYDSTSYGICATFDDVFKYSKSGGDAFIAFTPEYITLTSLGSGIQTVVVQTGNDEFANAIAGQAFGESAHIQTVDEVGQHYHTMIAYDSVGEPLSDGVSGAPSNVTGVLKNTSLWSTNDAMNITQPTLALPHIIKL